MRLKIYYQYSTVKVLNPTKGDFINEISNMKALSKFADVYYSGSLFDENAPNFGMSNNLNKPEDFYPKDYDLVYVRANKKVFLRAKKYNIPTIWMASPYYHEAFMKSDIIGTFSLEWDNCLKKGTELASLNPYRIKFKNALSLYQTVGDEFKPLQDNKKTIKIRKQIGGDFIIGCFGRIVKSNYPYLLIYALPRLIKAIPNIKIVFGVTASQILPKNLPSNVIFTKYEYSDMPYALSACDLSLVSSVGMEWNFCGSLKSIESAACGVPVVCAESSARCELLGEKYPLFMPISDFETPIYDKSINDFVQLILKYYNDRVALNSICSYVRQKSLFYSIDSSSKRWENIINELIKK